LGRREIFDKLPGAHAQGAEWCQSSFESRVIKFLRLQLCFDPFVDAHFFDPLNLAGSRPKGKPIQGMESLFVCVHRERAGN
jgi:hypothetical protein